MDEELYLHERIFSYDHPQFSNLMEGMTYLFGFLGEEPNLHL